MNNGYLAIFYCPNNHNALLEHMTLLACLHWPTAAYTTQTVPGRNLDKGQCTFTIRWPVDDVRPTYNILEIFSKFSQNR